MSTKNYSKIWDKSSSEKKYDDKLASNTLLDSNKILETDNKAEIKFYSDDSKKSFLEKEDQFTNFLNKNQVEDFKFRMLEFLTKPNSLYNSTSHWHKVDKNKRLKHLFSLKLSVEDITKHLDDIHKVHIVDNFGTMTAYRIYLYKNIEKNEYLIFLIDPLHLAIPSEETLNDKVYINNRGNTICISDII